MMGTRGGNWGLSVKPSGPQSNGVERDPTLREDLPTQNKAAVTKSCPSIAGTNLYSIAMKPLGIVIPIIFINDPVVTCSIVMDVNAAQCRTNNRRDESQAHMVDRKPRAIRRRRPKCYRNRNEPLEDHGEVEHQEQCAHRGYRIRERHAYRIQNRDTERIAQCDTAQSRILRSDELCSCAAMVPCPAARDLALVCFLLT
jgi:hypothetical protein